MDFERASPEPSDEASDDALMILASSASAIRALREDVDANRVTAVEQRVFEEDASHSDEEATRWRWPSLILLRHVSVAPWEALVPHLDDVIRTDMLVSHMYKGAPLPMPLQGIHDRNQALRQALRQMKTLFPASTFVSAVDTVKRYDFTWLDRLERHGFHLLNALGVTYSTKEHVMLRRVFEYSHPTLRQRIVGFFRQPHAADDIRRVFPYVLTHGILSAKRDMGCLKRIKRVRQWIAQHESDIAEQRRVVTVQQKLEWLVLKRRDLFLEHHGTHPALDDPLHMEMKQLLMQLPGAYPSMIQPYEDVSQNWRAPRAWRPFHGLLLDDKEVALLGPCPFLPLFTQAPLASTSTSTFTSRSMPPLLGAMRYAYVDPTHGYVRVIDMHHGFSGHVCVKPFRELQWDVRMELLPILVAEFVYACVWLWQRGVRLADGFSLWNDVVVVVNVGQDDVVLVPPSHTHHMGQGVLSMVLPRAKWVPLANQETVPVAHWLRVFFADFSAFPLSCVTQSLLHVLQAGAYAHALHHPLLTKATREPWLVEVNERDVTDTLDRLAYFLSDGGEDAMEKEPIVLVLRRDKLVDSFLYHLQRLTMDQVSQPLMVRARFVSTDGVYEMGDDQGGLMREAIHLFWESIMAPEQGFFEATETHKCNMVRQSTRTVEEWKALMKMIVLTLVNRCLLPAWFPTFCLAQLLGLIHSENDLCSLDDLAECYPVLAQSWALLLAYPVKESDCYTIEGEVVTERNKHHMVLYGAYHMLQGPARDPHVRHMMPLPSCLDGYMTQAVPLARSLIARVQPVDPMHFLALVRMGPEEDLDHVAAQALTQQWLATFLKENPSLVSPLLQFMAGCTYLLPNGTLPGHLSNLFVHVRPKESSKLLPTAHTCAAVMTVPLYDSYDNFSEKFMILLTKLHGNHLDFQLV